MKFKFSLSLLFIMILSACGSQVAIPNTVEPSSTPEPTATIVPTETMEPTPVPTSTLEPVSYAEDILPIFQRSCIVCHGGERGTEEGLNLSTYQDLLHGSDNGVVIIPGDAANSLLIEMVTSKKMPKRGPKLLGFQIKLIADWINQGASEN